MKKEIWKSTGPMYYPFGRPALFKRCGTFFVKFGEKYHSRHRTMLAAIKEVEKMRKEWPTITFEITNI